MSSSDPSSILSLYTTLLLLQSLSDNGNQPDRYKTVSTQYGLVRGQLNTTFLEAKPYYYFKGIPYAKTPIGELRFKVVSVYTFSLCIWICLNRSDYWIFYRHQSHQIAGGIRAQEMHSIFVNRVCQMVRIILRYHQWMKTVYI